MPGMRRRDFIALLGGAAAAWPIAVRAQQAAMPVIGFLDLRSPSEAASVAAKFREGLNEVGYIEGQNVVIEYRWAEGQVDRLPALAAEMVRRQVAVMFAGSTPSILSAKAATTSIPIVFVSAGDPVQLGVIASFNRPGGNATGVNLFTTALELKKLELLHEFIPKPTIIGVLLNPSYVHTETQSNALRAAAGALGRQINFVNASNENDIEVAFAALAERRIGAVLVTSIPIFTGQRNHLVALASRHAVPAIYGQREFVAAGGLMSYGTNLGDAYRQAGVYTGRILKGEKPADLPVQQPTKFELVINLNTAKALGLAISPGVLAIADEVIE